MHWARSIATGLSAAGFMVGTAPADEVTRTLVGLDQRVHIMSLELKETALPSGQRADERVVDADALARQGHHHEATAISLDVIERWPGTRAAQDATFLMAESLRALGDTRTARRYYELAAKAFAGTRRAQRALEGLVEIALRTGDFTHIEEHLLILSQVPAAAREPSVTYVRAKYFYFRQRFDEAASIFASIEPGSPYYFLARYFLATIQVRNRNFDRASAGFAEILALSAGDPIAREIQDLARLAQGRISFEHGQIDRAVEFYRGVDPQSKHYADALFEMGWSQVKGTNFEGACLSFERLLASSPDAVRAPELRLMVGILHLHLADFARARESFTRTRDDLDPIHTLLRAALARSRTDPHAFEVVFGDSEAVKWVRADPTVIRLLAAASGLDETGRDLAAAKLALGQVETALANTDGVVHFADLQRTRTGSHVVRGALDTLQVSSLRPVSLRVPGTDGVIDMDMDLEVLSRIGALESQLSALDTQVREEAGARVSSLKGAVAVERTLVAQLGVRLTQVDRASRVEIEDLLGQALTRVADHIAALILRSDAGLIDVSWGLKYAQSTALDGLLLQRKMELDTAEQELRQIMRDEAEADDRLKKMTRQ